MDWANKAIRRDEKHLSFDIWCVWYQNLAKPKKTPKKQKKNSALLSANYSPIRQWDRALKHKSFEANMSIIKTFLRWDPWLETAKLCIEMVVWLYAQHSCRGRGGARINDFVTQKKRPRIIGPRSMHASPQIQPTVQAFELLHYHLWSIHVMHS